MSAIDAAIKLQEQAVTLDKKVLGPEHLNTLNAMNNLAAFYFNAGRRDEAIQLWEQTVALDRKVLGPEHPQTIQTQKNLASMKGLMAREAQAGVRPMTQPADDDVDGLEAAAKALTGYDGNRADALYRKAIKFLRLQTPVDEKRIAADEVLEAEPLLNVGQKSGVLTSLRDALRIDQRLLGPKDPTTVAVATQLADMLDEKHPEEAAKVRADAGLTPATTQSAK